MFTIIIFPIYLSPHFNAPPLVMSGSIFKDALKHYLYVTVLWVILICKFNRCKPGCVFEHTRGYWRKAKLKCTSGGQAHLDSRFRRNISYLNNQKKWSSEVLTLYFGHITKPMTNTIYQLCSNVKFSIKKWSWV